MHFLHTAVDVFLHLDKHLNVWAGWLGPWLYAFLFLVVFAETGLVVTPYLPGDSLLFAVGALAASEGSPIRIGPVIVLLMAAAVIGDAVNYSIGRWPGLAPEALFEGRDLAVTSDFRQVLTECLEGHMGLGGAAGAFPGFVPGKSLGLFS